MKTPRYKFDDVWKEAIRLMPYQGEEYTEMVIRGYIENGRDADTEFRETNFECAWLLIKAQIDARKERNLRARRKRMFRRELIVAERARIAAAEEQRRAAAEAARVAAEETAAAARSERNRIKRESRVDRTNCITARTAAWRRLSVGRESRSVKPSFSDRFRGPGYKAATIKTEQAPARLPEPAVCRLNDVGRD